MSRSATGNCIRRQRCRIEIQVGPYRYQSVPKRFMNGFGHRKTSSSSRPTGVENEQKRRSNRCTFRVHAVGGTRTPNLQVRSLLLYPIELRPHTSPRRRLSGIPHEHSISFTVHEEKTTRAMRAVFMSIGEGEIRTLGTVLSVRSFSKRLPSATRPPLQRALSGFSRPARVSYRRASSRSPTIMFWMRSLMVDAESGRRRCDILSRN